VLGVYVTALGSENINKHRETKHRETPQCNGQAGARRILTSS